MWPRYCGYPQHPRAHYRNSNEPEMNGPFARGSFRWARLFQDAAARFRLQQRDRPLFGAARGDARGRHGLSSASGTYANTCRPVLLWRAKILHSGPTLTTLVVRSSQGPPLQARLGKTLAEVAAGPSGGAPGGRDRRWAPGPRPWTLMRPLGRGGLARASNVRLPFR